MAWLSKGDSKKNWVGEDESALKRLNQVLSSSNGIEDADPEEIEARIRNLAHGTNSEYRVGSCGSVLSTTMHSPWALRTPRAYDSSARYVARPLDGWVDLPKEPFGK